MRGIKRTVRKNGPVLGHRDGIAGIRLLSYIEALLNIYLPSYRWILESNVPGLVSELRILSARSDVVLLDVTVNGDISDMSSPLSHAALVCRYVGGAWPSSL